MSAQWQAIELTLAIWDETELALKVSPDGSEEAALWCPRCWVDVIERTGPMTIVASLPVWKVRELGWRTPQPAS